MQLTRKTPEQALLSPAQGQQMLLLDWLQHCPRAQVLLHQHQQWQGWVWAPETSGRARQPLHEMAAQAVELPARPCHHWTLGRLQVSGKRPCQGRPMWALTWAHLLTHEQGRQQASQERQERVRQRCQQDDASHRLGRLQKAWRWVPQAWH